MKTFLSVVFVVCVAVLEIGAGVGCWLAAPVYAQSDVVNKPAPTATATPTPAAPPIESDLRAQMRDNQWAQAKNAIQMQQLSNQYTNLQTQNNDLDVKLRAMADVALKAAKLDSKLWHVNYDTMSFEATPATTSVPAAPIPTPTK